MKQLSQKEYNDMRAAQMMLRDMLALREQLEELGEVIDASQNFTNSLIEILGVQPNTPQGKILDLVRDLKQK